MSEEPIVESTDPDEAFGLLSDATRLDILRALWEAPGHEATFSELRGTVGTRDSGRFNYHLGRLTGQFVARTDDGYELTVAGRRVYGALLAGRYTKTGSIDPVPLDEACPSCGGDRTFRYDGQRVEIECDGCALGTFFGVPPGAFAGYDTDRWPAVAERYMRTTIRRAVDGFCPFCDGRMRPRLAEGVATTDPEGEPPEPYRQLPTYRYTCERCDEELAGDLGVALLNHPAVVSFYHDRGVDVRRAPLARFRTLADDAHEIRGRDPLRVGVTYEADGATLTLVVDEGMRVLETERTDG